MSIAAPRAVPLGNPDAAGEPVSRAEPPRVLVLLCAVSLALLPVLRPSATGNTSPVDVPMGLSMVAAVVWALRAQVRLHVPYAVPVIVLVLAGLLATLFSPLPTAALSDLLKDVYLLVWTAVLVNVWRSGAALRLSLRVWVASSAVWAAVLIATYFLHLDAISGVNSTDGPRASLLTGDPNMLATYFDISIMVVVATRFPRRLPLRLGVVGLLLGGLALTLSNGGAIALLLAGAVTLAIIWARRSPLTLALGLAAVLSLVGASALAGVSPSTLQDAASASGNSALANSFGRSTESSYERTTILQESIDLFNQDGWIGWGPQTTKSVLDAQLGPYPNEAHDDYMAALSERGLLGGLGVVLLIFAIGFRARSLLPPIGGREGAFADALPMPAALFGAVIGVAFMSTNEEILHARHVWALFAAVAAYHLWAKGGRT